MEMRFKPIALAAVAAVMMAAGTAKAADYDPIDYTSLLSGNVADNYWSDLSSVGSGPGFGGFPGTSPWPAPGIASQVNTNADAAYLTKVNGPAGGPYPAGGSIYFGGFSAELNYNGGGIIATDSTPIADLSNIVYQVAIGEAWTYDFWNRAAPTLTLTFGDSTTTTLAADFSETLAKVDNGTVTMPTGEENIYINLYAYQWDLASYDDIASYSLSFNGVQHAQLYDLRLTQSDTFTQVVAVPETSTYALFTAGLGLIGGIARRRPRADKSLPASA